jgi:hypothetical protein
VNAKQILSALDPGIGDAEIIVRRQLLLGEVALVEGQPYKALQLLNINLPADLPPELQVATLRMRASIYAQTNDPVAFARERIQLGHYLTDEDAINKNSELIWQSLSSLTPELLQQLGSTSADTELAGWAELALIARQYEQDQQGLLSELQLWRRRHPQHPAPEHRLSSGGLPVARRGMMPSHIGVLLPADNRYAAYTTPVRDGFLAAYYNDNQSNPRPRITFYQVTPENVASTYQQAIAAGADMVVGPLTKDSVTNLAARGNLSVPVLALNRVSSQAQLPPQLYQFGLSPENEAQQVAERIMLDGLRQGVAMVPEGPWGERILQTFSERLTQLGGELVDVAFYKANDKVFSEPTQRLLKINESVERHKRLKRLLNDDIKFEQRRRQDIDFVFLAAFPRQARQIRPELKFFSAGNLPVYATSHVYSGKLDPARDNDMDGIIFGDIPWLLQSSASTIKTGVEQAWPQLAGSQGRLYAMGADSYNVLPYLKRLGTHPLERYFGETGVLQLDASRQLNRQLLWARFVNGVPTRLQTAAVPAMETGAETTGNVPETTPQTR